MKRYLYLLAAVLLLPPRVSATENLGLKTVVIDAGHGGKDPGAVSVDKKYYEKNFNVDIAKRLAEKIKANYPEVKVLLTRDTDVFVSLDDRAVYANKVNADLFISIHHNANRNRACNGYSVHILGQSAQKNRDLFAYNMDICRRENSVILMEDDYSTNYMGFDPNDYESYIFMQLMRNAFFEQSIEFAEIISSKLGDSPFRSNHGVSQDPFYVLWKTSMPAVLVELGFMTNSEDVETLANPKSRDRIATCLMNAFRDYKTQYDSSMRVELKPAPGQAEKQPSANPAATPEKATEITPENRPGTVPKAKPAEAAVKKPENKPAAAPETPEILYGIQAFAVSAKIPDGDPRLLGYKPLTIKSGNLNKYFLGVSNSLDITKKELAKVKSKYPDCYLVKITGEHTERVPLR